MSLTVAIIARDEARHIGAALASVHGLAARVLVLLDDRTTDASAHIATTAGAEVQRDTWISFPAQRNRALALCESDWLLFLDADERVSPALAAELPAIISVSDGPAGYRIPRQNIFFGRVVRGGGWFPDHQLRLLRCGAARYDERVTVHETPSLTGAVADLHGHLEHLNIERLGELWHKQRGYAIQEAHSLYRSGRRARARNVVGAPLREFYRRFVQLRGYQDGALGLLLCGTLAYFEIIKYVHLAGIQQAKV